MLNIWMTNFQFCNHLLSSFLSKCTESIMGQVKMAPNKKTNSKRILVVVESRRHNRNGPLNFNSKYRTESIMGQVKMAPNKKTNLKRILVVVVSRRHNRNGPLNFNSKCRTESIMGQVKMAPNKKHNSKRILVVVVSRRHNRNGPLMLYLSLFLTTSDRSTPSIRLRKQSLMSSCLSGGVCREITLCSNSLKY
jgi:hypothetical protein